MRDSRADEDATSNANNRGPQSREKTSTSARACAAIAPSTVAATPSNIAQQRMSRKRNGLRHSGVEQQYINIGTAASCVRQAAPG
jgi:hypothetical protein